MTTQNIYSMVDTWNNAGTTFTGIGLSVTDTASAAGSLLLDLQVGGTSQAKISKGGVFTTLGRANINTLTIGLGGQTSVASNTAVGYQALNSASLTGTACVGVGYQAMFSNTSGSDNVAVGNAALYGNTTGGNNSALGNGALQLNTTGGSNTSMGFGALYSNTTANNNSAIGRNALLYYNTSINTAVGFEAARGSATVANNTGASLTAVGYQALFVNTSGIENAAVGYAALYSNTTGDANCGMGAYALYGNTTGTNNTGCGKQAGDAITTGARNTIVGAESDPSAAGGNDQTVVGHGLTGKGDDTAFIGGTNGAYNEKNVTTWETTSDARIKKNIADFNDGLAVIEALRVRTFEYRTPEEITELPQSAAIDRAGVQLGVTAQEIQQVLPECVTQNSTGVLSVSTDPLVWHLVAAVKQLSAEIKALKGQ